MKYFKFICLLAVLSFFVSGCDFLNPYTPPVDQGKIISKNIMSQIKPNMSKDQIRFLLGTPDIIDVFDKDTWIYVRYLERSQDFTDNNLVLKFKNNKLIDIYGNYNPPYNIYLTQSV